MPFVTFRCWKAYVISQYVTVYHHDDSQIILSPTRLPCTRNGSLLARLARSVHSTDE